MDREKDIGPIYNLYKYKNEKYSANNNPINNTANNAINNEDRISDIENSITASLISDNKKTKLCNNNETQIYISLLILILALGLLIVGIYFLITEYNK
jgi:hypothetical protein